MELPLIHRKPISLIGNSKEALYKLLVGSIFFQKQNNMVLLPFIENCGFISI